MLNVKICSKCDISKPLDEFTNRKDSKDGKRGACKKCENKRLEKYRQEHREEISERNKKDYRKHIKERKRYHEKYRGEHKDEIRQKAGQLPMHENKECAAYLGVFIAEHLCRHLFKDVEVMPYGNPSFDFICNKGKNIDVKSSCTRLRDKKYQYWEFNIKHNTIVDFFICVAFDNRENTIPLHLWMIPGNEINNKGKISIRSSTIHKWSQWERSIEEVQMCCIELKK